MVTVGSIHCGTKHNIIPEAVKLQLTVRTFSDSVTALFEEKMRHIATLTAQAHGAHAELEFLWNYPPTVNHVNEARFAADVAASVVGADRVNSAQEPTMGAEDFAFMLKARPGAYLFIGNGEGGHRDGGHGLGPCMLHNPSYDFNDDLIPIGASFFSRLVERFLAR